MTIYKKSLLGCFWHLRGQTKGAKGGEGASLQRLNAPQREKDNLTRGGGFDTPGGGAVEGGGVTSPKVRGTKNGK